MLTQALQSSPLTNYSGTSLTNYAPFLAKMFRKLKNIVGKVARCFGAVRSEHFVTTDPAFPSEVCNGSTLGRDKHLAPKTYGFTKFNSTHCSYRDHLAAPGFEVAGKLRPLKTL